MTHVEHTHIHTLISPPHVSRRVVAYRWRWWASLMAHMVNHSPRLAVHPHDGARAARVVWDGQRGGVAGRKGGDAMTIVTSREQRRQMARDSAKLPQALQRIPRHEWPNPNVPQLEVWRSRNFLVQVFAGEGEVKARLSINRTELAGTRWVEGISWDELQRLKNECGFANFDAVEVFPRARDVVNVANMRHLWVLHEPLAFAWRGE